MKFSPILVLVLAISLSGCSAKPPINTAMSHPQNSNPENWRTGYEWTTPQSDSPVMLVADYRHVLTANPPAQYTAPPVPAPAAKKAEPPSHLDHQPVAQAAPPKVEPVIVPAPALPPPATKLVLKTVPINKSTETAYDRAWRRYCNNGREMTDEDRQIVGDEKIPEKFQKTCRPPK